MHVKKCHYRLIRTSAGFWRPTHPGHHPPETGRTPQICQKDTPERLDAQNEVSKKDPHFPPPRLDAHRRTIFYQSEICGASSLQLIRQKKKALFLSFGVHLFS